MACEQAQELRTARPCAVCGERSARVREVGRVCLVCEPREEGQSNEGGV